MKINPKVKAVTEEAGQYGAVHLNSKSFPCLEHVKLGDEFELELKVKVKEVHFPNSFELNKMGLTPKHKVYHMEVTAVESPEEEIAEMKLEKMKLKPKGGYKGHVKGKGY